jgi:hypothetical protein
MISFHLSDCQKSQRVPRAFVSSVDLIEINSVIKTFVSSVGIIKKRVSFNFPIDKNLAEC